MTIGLMYGNHTFLTWDSTADACAALSEDPSLAENAEMAFRDDSRANIHRTFSERTESFAARAIELFKLPQSTAPWSG